ncbi:MAG: hypothetical protein ABIK37_05050, partial [candidate division WOR-3 bacterium]
MSATPPARSGRLETWFWLLIVLALGLRLAAGVLIRARMSPGEPVTAPKTEVEYLRSPYMELGDSQQYLLLAESLTKNGAFGWGAGPVTFRLPGYPTLLALLGNRMWLIVLVQAVFGALVVLMSGMIGRRLGGDAGGLVAAGLVAADVGSVLHVGLVMSESLFLLLLVLAVFMFLSRTNWAAGLALGAAAMTRPIALPAFVPMALVLLVRGQRRQLALFLVAFAVLPGLWLARNWRSFGIPGFTSNGGFNTFYAAAGALVAEREGISIDSARVQLATEHALELDGDNPLRVGAAMGRIGRELIRQDFPVYIRVYCRGVAWILFGVKADDLVSRIVRPEMRLSRARLVLRSGELRRAARTAAVGLAAFELLLTAVILVTAVAGLGRLRRDLDAWLLLGLAVFFVLAASPLTDGRFRMPAIPLLAMLAGGAVSRRLHVLTSTA